METFPGQREIDLDELGGRSIPNPFHYMPKPVTVRNGRDMRPLNPYEVQALGRETPDALTNYGPIFQAGAPFQKQADFYGVSQQTAQPFAQQPLPQYATQQAAYAAVSATPKQAVAMQQALAQMQAYVVQGQQQTQQQINALAQQIAGMSQVTMELLQAKQEEQAQREFVASMDSPVSRDSIREALDSLIGELAGSQVAQSQEENNSDESNNSEEPEEGVNIAEWES